MESNCLAWLEPLLPLRDWLEIHSFSTLLDLSSWSPDESWLRWINPHPPPHLSPLFSELFSSLQGSAPHHQRLKDTHGWGNAYYTVNSEYYSFLEAANHCHPRSSTWTIVWHSDEIPKINFFCWLLAHKKVLTAENLKTRGICGPSRCVMCQSEEETLQHLFIECNYAKENRNHALGSLTQRFNQWGSHYSGSFKEKPIFKRYWDTLPKYICWSIWLARNKQIFNDETQNSKIAALKACTLLTKYMRNQVHWKDQHLDSIEES